jgi:hypothetical protein
LAQYLVLLHSILPESSQRVTFNADALETKPQVPQGELLITPRKRPK